MSKTTKRAFRLALHAYGMAKYDQGAAENPYQASNALKREREAERKINEILEGEEE